MVDVSSQWWSAARPGNPPSITNPNPSRSIHASRANNFRHASPRHHPTLSTKASGKGFGRSKNTRPQANSRRPDLSHLPQADPPLYDSQEVNRIWTSEEPPRKEWIQNPKGVLNNFSQQLTHPLPKYQTQQVAFTGFDQPIFRATLQLESAADIVGIGDDFSKKEAEKLAALSVCYQLGLNNMFDENNLPLSNTPEKTRNDLMPDGTQLTLVKAKSYMTFYCRKFKFSKPDIEYESNKVGKGRQSWIATLYVGGVKIGFGQATSKKDALDEAYLDTVVYLGECDPNLWQEFSTSPENEQVAEVVFKLSEPTESDLRRIVHSSRDSELFRRAKIILANARGPGRASHRSMQIKVDNSNGQNSRSTEESDRCTLLEEKSAKLMDRLKAYQNDTSPQVVDLRQQRESLPVTAHSEQVLSAIAANPITILMAATGSGKTTQVPQLILDEAIMKGEGGKCNVICTQPRRIAAISVAQRVANERNENLCESVGYQVRFEAKPPNPNGSILFCTTGVFLRKLQNDMDDVNGAFIDAITHIVVDEVHERDIETDLLLFCLRKVLNDRKEKGKPEIKVLLMSATVDPTLFEQYFCDSVTHELAPVISIPGRSFPVEKHYLETIHHELSLLSLPPAQGGWVWEDPKVQKYLRRELEEPLALDAVTGKVLRDNDDLEMPFALIALVVAWVLSKSSEGHVLVFLPGWEEIKGVQNILINPRQFPLFGFDFNDKAQFEVHVLHSAIPIVDQQRVFSPPAPGIRRVILSTNIAETSVTIPDVVFVVDTGKIKEKRFDPQRHLSALVTAWVGTSNLNQRAGRAGRHRPGDYYGLLSRRRYDALNIHSTVEMKRTDLSNLVMHVKALNFPNMEAEDVLAQTIEPPESERVSAAMSHLQTIGALDRNKDLTALGRVLLQLPVEAQIGKLLLLGSFFKCLEPALNLAAILTNRDPFLSPPLAKAEADRVKSSWAPLEFRSDPLACLAAFKAWSSLNDAGETNKAHKFATENFLSKPTLAQISQVKSHLLSALRRAGVLAISGGGDFTAERSSRFQRWNQRDTIPAYLNKNSDSLPLCAALIAVAVAPNFAVRKSTRILATDKDRICFINLSSVNSFKKEAAAAEDIPLQNERQLFAFGEKSLQLPRPGERGQGQMSLRSTTRLDPLGYMLFGAGKLEQYSAGLKCDGWLPIVGNPGALDDVERLKHVLDASLLRVFDGLRAQILGDEPKSSNRLVSIAKLPKRNQTPRRDVPVDPELEEGEVDPEEEEEPIQLGKLTRAEVNDLQRLTEEVVSLLNKYSEERLATDVNASRASSRPESRVANNRPLISRLQHGGSMYGYNEGGGNSSAGPSRPPSRLTSLVDLASNHGNHQNDSMNHHHNPSSVPSKLTPGAGFRSWGNNGLDQHPNATNNHINSTVSNQPARSGLQSKWNPPIHPSSSSTNWRST